MQKDDKELSPEGARIAFWIFVGLLGIAIFGSIYTFSQSHKYQTRAKTTQGRIVKSMPKSGNTGYDVVVEYKNELKIPKQFHAGVAFHGTAARVGAPVTVCYVPGELGSARTKAWVDSSLRKYVPLAFVAGLLFFTALIGTGISQKHGFPFLIFQK